MSLTNEDPWLFDEGVAHVFDDMLKRSIPNYENMRELCYDVGCNFLKPREFIVDIGASRGEGIDPFIKSMGTSNKYVLIEKSKPMYDVLCSRYNHLFASDIVRVHNDDVRNVTIVLPVCLTLCVLTLQFIPLPDRQKVIDRVAQATTKGGALLLVEKVIGETSKIDDLFIKEYHALKERNGYSREEITRKALKLENVLIPVTTSYNIDMLKKAGFKDVDVFWKSLNFVGILAVK